MAIKQYQILLVNLNPTKGSEIKKTRPCLVISPEEMNRHLNTIIIAPMTSSSKIYPTRVPVFYVGKQNWVVLDQIRTIDKQRIVSSYNMIDAIEIKLIKTVLKELLVD